MRRVEIPAAAGRRFVGQIGAEPPSRAELHQWTGLGFVLTLAVVLHAAAAGGSLTCRDTHGSRPRPIQLESNMTLRTTSACLATTTILSCTAAFAQQCDELVVWGSNTYGGLNDIPNVSMVTVSSNYHLSVGLDPVSYTHLRAHET
jgi:hypothetical protein